MYESVNRNIAQAASMQDNAVMIEQRSIEGQIRRIRADLPNYSPPKAAVEARAEQLRNKANEGVFKWGHKTSEFEEIAREELIQEHVGAVNGQIKILEEDLERIASGSVAPSTQSSGTTSGSGSFESPLMPQTMEEVDKLPKGSIYKDPNSNKVYKK